MWCGQSRRVPEDVCGRTSRGAAAAIDRQVSDTERAQLANRFVGAPMDTADEAVAALLASDDPWLRSRVEIASQARAQSADDDHTPAPVGMSAGIGAG